MRLLMTIIGLFAVTPSSCVLAEGAASYGQDIQIVSQENKPRLGVQYTYDPLSVSFNLTATVSTKSLPATRPLFARVYDLHSSTFLSDWYPLALGNGTSQTEVIVFGLNRQDALKSLKALPNLILVFSSNKLTAEANMNLKLLCQNFPSNFVDMTLVAAGCAPDRSRLEALPENVGGFCSSDLHKNYCGGGLDVVRKSIEKQRQCVFKCD